MKLIDKIKPEILDALKESRISYKASYSVMITDKVHALFVEAECPEELDTTEDDNHPVEKLQN